MFYEDPLLGDASVVAFLFFAQGVFLASLVWHFTVPVQVLNALIATVGFEYQGRMQAGFAFFKEPEIMPSSLAYHYTDNDSFGGNNQLNL